MGTTLGTKLAENTPKSWYFTASISPNLRELQAFFATHNPKVAGSNPAPAIKKSLENKTREIGGLSV